MTTLHVRAVIVISPKDMNEGESMHVPTSPCRALQKLLRALFLSEAPVTLQSPGSSSAVNSVDRPDAKAAIQLLPTLPDRAAVSRSEGASPTAAAGQKGSAWTGRISHAVLTGPAKVPQSHASPSGRSSVPSRPSSAHGSSQSARG